MSATSTPVNAASSDVSSDTTTPSASAGTTSTPTRPGIRDGLGESVDRPDGPPKVSGAFAFSSDLYARGMLWGRTLRSPHPAARIVAIDTSEAEAMAGVASVITAGDVPGKPIYGLEHPDQPVFASEVVRYQGEPIAAVAAEHPELAKRAIDAIAVEYDVLDPLTDPDAAIDAPPIHPEGNVIRHLPLRHGDVEAAGEVTVEGTYELGMQDQAFMGPESGLAIPAEDGGVELYMSTQWLHVDRDQVAACLGLPTEKVRMTLAGVGGAFGAREDVSLQIHVCLLALRTNRPVKMIYNREESFFGHVHRHPARLWFRHHADREGNLVKVEARLVLDGGAYASTSSAVLANAVCFATGPYRVPNAHIDGYAVRTNNPPCGAMRGFGVVQACFGHESQMDRLAAALDMDPVELRLRNALETGDTLVTGQVVTGTAPVREVIEAAVAHDLPPPPGDDAADGPSGRVRAHRRAARPPARHRRGREHQEPDVLRGVRGRRDRRGPARARPDGPTTGDRAQRLRRGGAGLRHPRPADHAQHPRRRAGAPAGRRYLDRFRRLHQRLPADLDERWCGGAGLQRDP